MEPSLPQAGTVASSKPSPALRRTEESGTRVRSGGAAERQAAPLRAAPGLAGPGRA